MDNIKETIDNLKHNIKKLENKEYKDLFDGILNVLTLLDEKIESINERQDLLEEDMEYLDKDVTGIQDELFEEVTIEDLIEMDDEFTEIKCSNCNNKIFIEKDSLKNNKSIPCPFCKENAI